MTLPGPRCSQAVNVSSLMPSETLSLLAPLCDDEIDNSMSSEIPFTSLNHFRRSVPQTSADVEIPARTAAETTTCGNAVSCGSCKSSAEAVVYTDLNKSHTSASAAGLEEQEGGCHGSAVEIPNSDNVMSSSKIPSVTVADSLSPNLDHCSSLSPPKLMSFWQELDAVSDKSACFSFALNADDPPFIGFEEADILDTSMAVGCHTDSSEMWSCTGHGGLMVDCDSDGPCSCSKPASRSPSNTVSEVDSVKFSSSQHHGGPDAVNTESCDTSPWKSRTVCIPRKSRHTWDEVANVRGARPGNSRGSCTARESHGKRDCQKSLGVRHKDTESARFVTLPSISSAIDIVNSPASPPQYIVDEDIAFNLASPQKLRGIRPTTT